MKQSFSFSLIATLFLLGFSSVAMAGREASFVDPRASATKSDGDHGAVVVEPKNDIDLGENGLGVTRRVTVFFINVSAAPVDITSLSITGDGELKTALSDDECSQNKKIEVGGRCLVTAELVPSSPGAWSADLILVYKGAGQVAHVHLHGKVSGSASQERRETGLLLSTKDAKPIDFGNVDADGGRVTRSILMVNDSTEAIRLLSIDLIAPENGLDRLSQGGCTTDLVLQPGESCPITLVWNPVSKGLIATDVIIRHTGKLGFAVIPVRGVAKTDGKSSSSSDRSPPASASKSSANLPMPTANELDSIMGKLPPVSGDSLGGKGNVSGSSNGIWRLIGTVGGRAILHKPDGSVVVAAAGDDVSIDGNKATKIIEVSGRSAIIQIGKTRKTLLLQSSPDLVEKAIDARQGSGKKKSSSSVGNETAGTGTSHLVNGPGRAAVSLDDLLKGPGSR